MAPPGKGKGEQKPRHQRKEKRGRPLPKQGRAGPAAVNPCPRAHPAGLQTRQPQGPHALERTPARPPDRAHPQGPPPEHPSTRPRGTTAAPPHGRWCGLPGLACSWGPWGLLDGHQPQWFSKPDVWGFLSQVQVLKAGNAHVGCKPIAPQKHGLGFEVPPSSGVGGTTLKSKLCPVSYQLCSGSRSPKAHTCSARY